jgi:hypothetical protein
MKAIIIRVVLICSLASIRAQNHNQYQTFLDFVNADSYQLDPCYLKVEVGCCYPKETYPTS